MITAYLGLGSNLGDRMRSLCEALERLGEQGIEITAASSVYESKPVLVTDQPDFLNMAARVVTSLPPRGLLDVCLGLERDMGRVRARRWGPRSIDIDILLYGNEAISEPGLIVPHPRLHERSFALVPILEINPDMSLPGGELLRELPASRDLSGLSVFSEPPNVATDGRGEP